MNIMEKALEILEKYPLCDHCLGRQFASLGRNIENDNRGATIKLALTLDAHALAISKDKAGMKTLQILATNGFSKEAKDALQKIKKRIPEKLLQPCFLCENKFENLGDIMRKAAKMTAEYEYNTFLVGIKLPAKTEEKEDELRAEFDISFGENMRSEFGRIIGKKLAGYVGKVADYKKPDIVILINPLSEEIKIQLNPLYITGRYKKLVRGIPQSKWFCSHCRGKGCEKCNWTGKMYQESVEEIIEKPFLEVTQGSKAFFHGSGREDIDARMLGTGRPFAIEISNPKKRFLNLRQLEETVNSSGQGKVEISNLQFADKEDVRRLKKAEASTKKYRVLIEFENNITDDDLHRLEEELTNAVIKQKTPRRVLHRRADLKREKYIYEVKLKMLSPKKAEMKIKCQGGLYVKELVTGDEGRTTPSISEILKIPAKPIKLDVLDVIISEY